MIITDELKQSISNSLKDHLLQEDWQYIDIMFEEVYLTTEFGLEILTLKPHPNLENIGMQFYAINGAYYGINEWSYIQEIGERVQ